MTVPVSPAVQLDFPTDEWRSVDIGGHMDEGDHDPRVGFFEFRNPTDEYQREAGARTPGSDQDTRSRSWDQVGHFRFEGIRDRQAELYRGSQVEVWYHGYVDRRRGGSYVDAKPLPVNQHGTWYSVDMNQHTDTEGSPKMVFIRWIRTDEWGFRRVGSKHPTQDDNMISRLYNMVNCSFAFCDDQGTAELYVQDADVKPYIVGWVNDNGDLEERQRNVMANTADSWQTTDLGGMAQTDDIAWLLQGNRHWYATEDERVRVGARRRGSSIQNYDYAGLSQWRPVQLEGAEFEQRLGSLGAHTVNGAATWLLGRSQPMDIEREDPPDDPDDPDDPDEPDPPEPPEDPEDDLSPIGFVRADYDGSKVDLPVFNPEHVDGSCWRVDLGQQRVGAFGLAPREDAEWPRFTVNTESGKYAIHDLDVEYREPSPFDPSVTTGDVEFHTDN